MEWGYWNGEKVSNRGRDVGCKIGAEGRIKVEVNDENDDERINSNGPGNTRGLNKLKSPSPHADFGLTGCSSFGLSHRFAREIYCGLRGDSIRSFYLGTYSAYLY
jgi:hypothetical protein